VATVPADVDGPSDAELIEAVRKGTVSAYGSLWERHVASAYNLARQLSRSPAEADDLVSEAFAKVLDTLRGGRGPDSAFRAYLLTALRHTAYDKTRRDRKVELSDDVSTVSGVALAAVSEEFDDTAVAGLDRSLAAQAFQRLPERWQAVLWHTEIEGQSPAEVAPILGLTANGVSALAYRAREGLRQAYLQVHLAETEDRHCRAAAEKLGAWTRGGLAKREKAQVETHLDQCERCRSLAAELADVNGAMRGFVAPLVLGMGALGYLATTGGGGAAAGSVLIAGGAAGSVAGAAGAAPRQFLGVAASGVALAAAIVLGLTAGGGEPQEIPAVAAAPPSVSQQEPPPVTGAPPQQQPPAPQQPPQQQPPTQQEQPQQQPGTPAPQTPPLSQAPPQLQPTGPATPVALVAGGDPVDLPLTIRNTGGTRSDPVTAVLTLPPGVSAVPVDGFAAPRLLSLNGAKAGPVNCPGGIGVVTCSSPSGLAPNETVTLLFRLRASDDAKSGQVTGVVSAGTAMRVNVNVLVQVKPKPVRDDLVLAAGADWAGLLWFHPVVEVTVTNSGTSSLPVTVTVDQRAAVRWSSQEVTCTSGGPTTSCTTVAEVTPGEKFTIVLEFDADPWLEHSPNRDQVHVSATLGTATDHADVTLFECLWPVEPTAPTPPAPQPPQPSVPSTSSTPPAPTGTTTAPGAPPKPTEQTKPTTPLPPVTTTTPPMSPPATEPGQEEQPPPSSSTPPSGGLGGLLGWLLGG
jgi:RNA polymerase sigma factor (sigma-70 family)